MTANNLKNKSSEFRQKHLTKIFCIVCFLVTNLFLMSFLYPADSPIMGHDYRYHYLRVEAVKYNIENNNLFSGIDYLYFGGGGYAGFAYPELFLYIPALLRVFGVGIGESMAVFLILCNVFSYCFMFIFLRDISNSPVCGTIGAVMYVLSSYRLDNIITRFALGEVMAYVFWPLILYGLYDFIFGEFKKPYIIGIGFVGMLLSHTISTALALILCVVVSLVFIKRILKAPKKLITLSVTAGCAILLTAYYWLPLLELLLSCEMSVQVSAYNTVDNAVPFIRLFKDIMDGGGVAGMKFPVFLLCVPRVFLMRNSPVAKMYLQDEKTQKRRNILAAADAFMTIGIVLAIMSTDLVPWEFLSVFLNFIQFPWRLFAPSSILLIIAGTVYVYYIAEFTKAPKTAMVLIAAVSVLIAFIHAAVGGVNHTDSYDTNYYGDVSKTYEIGQGEWLPRAAQGDGVNSLRTMGDTVLLSNSESLPCVRDNGTLTFDLNENGGVDFATLPYIWYKGYEAQDENGRKLDISMSENGLVQVDMRGAEGRITVEHKPTAIKIVSYFISLTAIVVLAALAVILHRKRKQTALSE